VSNLFAGQCNSHRPGVSLRSGAPISADSRIFNFESLYCCVDSNPPTGTKKIVWKWRVPMTAQHIQSPNPGSGLELLWTPGLDSGLVELFPRDSNSKPCDFQTLWLPNFAPHELWPTPNRPQVLTKPRHCRISILIQLNIID